MKKLIILFSIALSAGCSDWLNVQPKTEVGMDEMFDTYKGFRDALSACYIKLEARPLYGEHLSMASTETMAGLWHDVTSFVHDKAYAMGQFDYESEQAKGVIDDIFSGLYNVIVQANTVITNMPGKGHNIVDPAVRAVIEGEALAVRAFCHFDALRLFGQMPSGGTRKVSLPYSEKVSREFVPYYDYEQFIAKIETDLLSAEELLKDNDPLFRHTYLELGNLNEEVKAQIDDTFLTYRQFRFNYYSIKALQARFYLYTGQNQKAYDAAKTVIDAKTPDGIPVVTLAGVDDFGKKAYALPSECLTGLSNYRLSDLNYSIRLLGGLTGTAVSTQLSITKNIYDELYVGFSGNNHALYVWNTATKDSNLNPKYTIRKYLHEEDANFKSRFLMVPLLRLSEVYLIAIETATLAEANTLWATYLLARGMGSTTLTAENLKTEMINEYRREFFAEGQMFFTYKRNGTKNMLWRNEVVTEDNYIVPLPETEFNPNETKL